MKLKKGEKIIYNGAVDTSFFTKGKTYLIKAIEGKEYILLDDENENHYITEEYMKSKFDVVQTKKTFEVGDIVVGKPNNGYVVTNGDEMYVGKVCRIRDNYTFDAKIMYHLNPPANGQNIHKHLEIEDFILVKNIDELCATIKDNPKHYGKDLSELRDSLYKKMSSGFPFSTDKFFNPFKFTIKGSAEIFSFTPIEPLQPSGLIVSSGSWLTIVDQNDKHISIRKENITKIWTKGNYIYVSDVYGDKHMFEKSLNLTPENIHKHL